MHTEGYLLTVRQRMILFISSLNQSDHNGFDEVRIQLIDKCSGEQQLREREAQWAYQLRFIYPQGLNSDDFFCSRNPRKDIF